MASDPHEHACARALGETGYRGGELLEAIADAIAAIRENAEPRRADRAARTLLCE